MALGTILTSLVSPITNYLSTREERKVRTQEIEQAVHLKKLDGIQASEASEFAADATRAESMKNSWKDEYITIIISIPVILCFMGTEGATLVAAGFTALQSTPDYYQYMLVSIFSVGAGVPLVGKTVNVVKGIMGK